jgi:hypothetical protein
MLEKTPPVESTLFERELPEVSRLYPTTGPMRVNIFNTRRVENPARGENLQGNGTGDGAGSLNQLVEEDTTLRIQGIVTYSDMRFAVLEISGIESGSAETVKIFPGDQVRGYFVENISKKHVALSKDGEKNIRLQIFQVDPGGEKK